MLLQFFLHILLLQKKLVRGRHYDLPSTSKYLFIKSSHKQSPRNKINNSDSPNSNLTAPRFANFSPIFVSLTHISRWCARAPRADPASATRPRKIHATDNAAWIIDNARFFVSFFISAVKLTIDSAVMPLSWSVSLIFTFVHLWMINKCNNSVRNFFQNWNKL